MNKYFKFSIIAFGLEVLLALAFCVISVKPTLHLLLLFVPSAFLAIMGFIGKSEKSKRVCKKITAACLPFILLGQLLLLIALPSIISETPVTDEFFYSRAKKFSYYSSWSEKHNIKFFPEQIPENAENVEFIYSPSFIPGIETLALCMDIQPDKIEEYILFASENCAMKGKLCDIEENFPINAHPFYPENIAWSDKTQVFVFCLDPTQTYYNHGTIGSVIADTENGKVLFVFDTW